MRLAYGDSNVLKCNIQFLYDRFFTSFHKVENGERPSNTPVGVVNSKDQQGFPIFEDTNGRTLNLIFLVKLLIPNIKLETVDTIYLIQKTFLYKIPNIILCHCQPLKLQLMS